MNVEQEYSCRKPMPIYQQLRSEILEKVERGELRHGSKLPTEEEFARRLGISRGTVRQAFVQLTEEGIVRKFPRKGTFISLDNLRHVMRIGVLSPQLRLDTDNQNDFYLMEMLGGMQEGLMQSGSMLIPLNAADTADEIAEFCQRRQVNGVIFLMSLRCDEAKMAELKKKLHLPMVVIAADPNEEINVVTGDDEYGSGLVAKHLLSCGHQRIGAVFVDSSEYASAERYRGFMKLLSPEAAEESAPFIKTITPDLGKRFIESYKAVKEIMSAPNPPTAIYAGGAMMLLGALRALKELKLDIPGDVSVIGYDDFFLAEYNTPPLTVVAQPIWQMGRRGIELLIERIENGIGGPWYKERLKPKLIIRHSTRKI